MRRRKKGDHHDRVTSRRGRKKDRITDKCVSSSERNDSSWYCKLYETVSTIQYIMSTDLPIRKARRGAMATSSSSTPSLDPLVDAAQEATASASSTTIYEVCVYV